jgi:hypothetical protein
LNAALEQAVVEIAAEQRAALAAGLAPRAVTVCEDETFHPAICLAALEPVSGFILLEQYAADRTAQTWTQTLDAACAGLPITLVQGTSDEAQPPEHLATRLEGIWQQLDGLAKAADLPARAWAHLAKARRLTTVLLATIAFFFATVQQRIEALNLAPDIEPAVLGQLIPALYIERVAARSTCAEARTRLHALSAAVLRPLREPDHPIQALDTDTRACIEQVAGDCADLFQRSSSAVEGRNGQLSLHHHGRHRLGDRKLAALTAVHNFHIRRPDGTTAAERFFGRAPPPLFEQLIARMPLPPRPRRRRPPTPKVPYLTPLAA